MLFEFLEVLLAPRRPRGLEPRRNKHRSSGRRPPIRVELMCKHVSKLRPFNTFFALFIIRSNAISVILLIVEAFDFINECEVELSLYPFELFNQDTFLPVDTL